MPRLRRLAGRRWIGACALAETIGMTAAATAALLAREVGPRPAALAIIVAGGLVEGVALGGLQGRIVGELWGPGAERGWRSVTVVVAGLGWALASAPSTLATDQDGGDSPPLVGVIGGAVALGAVMGTVLGAVQGAAVARTAGGFRTWSWVGTSALGWAAAMPVIFLGAAVPGSGWPAAGALAVAAPTGQVAGTVLGILTRRLVRIPLGEDLVPRPGG